jgi:hypothetical protein
MIGWRSVTPLPDAAEVDDPGPVVLEAAGEDELLQAVSANAKAVPTVAATIHRLRATVGMCEVIAMTSS